MEVRTIIRTFLRPWIAFRFGGPAICHLWTNIQLVVAWSISAHTARARSSRPFTKPVLADDHTLRPACWLGSVLSVNAEKSENTDQYFEADDLLPSFNPRDYVLQCQSVSDYELSPWMMHDLRHFSLEREINFAFPVMCHGGPWRWQQKLQWLGCFQFGQLR